MNAVACGDIAVTPGAVEFKGVQPDLIYVMPLTIRNRGKTMCRVRPSLPTWLPDCLAA